MEKVSDRRFERQQFFPSHPPLCLLMQPMKCDPRHLRQAVVVYLQHGTLMPEVSRGSMNRAGQSPRLPAFLKLAQVCFVELIFIAGDENSPNMSQTRKRMSLNTAEFWRPPSNFKGRITGRQRIRCSPR